MSVEQVQKAKDLFKEVLALTATLFEAEKKEVEAYVDELLKQYE